MILDNLAAYLLSGWTHQFVIEQFWVYPLMQILHFFGLCFLFGSLLLVDGRILGLCKFINMKESMKFIPVAIIGFFVNVISGYCFLAADPNKFLHNWGFQWKMIMVAVAGLNALWFTIGEHKEMAKLADGADAPLRAKVVAFTSLVAWISVIILGRMIPYTDFN